MKNSFIKKHDDKLWGALKRFAAAVCIAVPALWLFKNRGSFTAENIAGFAPENLFLAAVFLVLAYAVKSLVCFFPVVALQVAGGYMFSPLVAIAVNTVGMATCLCVPYFLGKRMSFERMSKNEKLRALIERGRKNEFFLCFFLRIVSIFPGDLVSMYLGGVKMPFFKYLLGGLLGTFPGIVSVTLIGSSVTDPTSPMFIISATVTVLLSAGSLLIYVLHERRGKIEKEEVAD